MCRTILVVHTQPAASDLSDAFDLQVNPRYSLLPNCRNRRAAPFDENTTVDCGKPRKTISNAGNINCGRKQIVAEFILADIYWHASWCFFVFDFFIAITCLRIFLALCQAHLPTVMANDNIYKRFGKVIRFPSFLTIFETLTIRVKFSCHKTLWISTFFRSQECVRACCSAIKCPTRGAPIAAPCGSSIVNQHPGCRFYRPRSSLVSHDLTIIPTAFMFSCKCIIPEGGDAQEERRRRRCIIDSRKAGNYSKAAGFIAETGRFRVLFARLLVPMQNTYCPLSILRTRTELRTNGRTAANTERQRD